MSLSILKPFTEHPATVGETYFSHLRSASGFSIRMLAGGLACLMHGLFPFLFETTGSSIVKKLHCSMVTHRVDCDEEDDSAVDGAAITEPS